MDMSRPFTDCAGAGQVMIELTHHRQRYNWDCGVSCVLMVLPELDRRHLAENLAAVCKEEGFNRSTWTIDLCYLLHRYGIRHEYSTVTLGVHPGYQRHSFYSGIIGRDGDRVNSRFELAASHGLNVSCRRLPLDALLNHLDTGFPAILLTSSRLLRCDRCKINRLSLELGQCLMGMWSPSFQGHYIVVCGYDKDTATVYYRNPSLPDHVCCTSYECLELARCCYGTDEDVIFITGRPRSRPS